MGISTRKAGTVVRCPKCAGEIIVPVPEGVEPAPSTDAPTPGAHGFDDANLEQLLNDATNGQTEATAAAPAPPQVQPEFPPITLPDIPAPAPKRVGFFMPLGLFIVSFCVVALLLILMFILGLIIGRHTATPDAKSARAPLDYFSGNVKNPQRSA
jgi:hypothetical protein